jgi:predicted nucleotidyltransferase
MTNFSKIWKSHLQEDGFDSSKLVVHEVLNSKFWEKGKLKPEVSEKLMEIAQDFHDLLKSEIPSIPDFDNVTFTGSLASYNYHNLSDIDLHVLINFGNLEDGGEILEKYFTAKRIQWNKTHKIMIFDHEVEIYIQDTNEEHFANGVYSILTQDWIDMPIKEKVDIDLEGTKKKYNAISKEIKELSSMFEDKKFKEVYDYSVQLKDKIKRMRQSGLEDEGTYSNENLAFKMLRINDELGTLSSLKIAAYDNMKSLDQKSVSNINIAENWWRFLGVRT